MGDVTTSRSHMVHGGNLAAARARYGDHSPEWIDLSTGINPHAYPIGDIASPAWQRLPDLDALMALERAAADAFGAGPHVDVVAAPGTQALIQLLPRLLPSRRVAVLDFTYQEHSLVFAAAGAEVEMVDSLDDLARADVAIIVNPNNPDGRIVPVDRLIDLAARLAGHGGWLVVDEAFADLEDPALSVIPRLPDSGVIVLRSFGKTYGLAGLRLGFAVTDPLTGGRIRDSLGPWAVPGPALAIGTRAYGDAGWREEMAARLQTDAHRLDALMDKAGFTPMGGTRLFRLHAHVEAAGWHVRLAGAHILTRAFPARPTWLRLGIPGRDEDWARLEAALTG